MDGIHDLGGKQGYGPIDFDEPEEPFHHAWEARLFGIVRAMSRPADWNIDWFRYCRELIDPVDYLTRPYFDQWLQTYAAMLVNSGIATVSELACGKAESRHVGLAPPMKASEVDSAQKMAVRFDRPSTAAPRYAVGDPVRVRPGGRQFHTRLPAYVRGCTGPIIQFHGVHSFPDATSLGYDRAEPLYTVRFSSFALTNGRGSALDFINLDLWESYLERT